MTRVERADELELSVHHRVRENALLTDAEYEIHAGFADVLEVPESLVHAVKTPDRHRHSHSRYSVWG